MLISVIIPSYQQAAYLPATLDSVFSQTDVDLEIIVIDGGSTDGSVDILRRHNAQLAYWVSEKDRGQSHAFNKGLAQARGDAWLVLNSDDLLLPGALAALATPMRDTSVNWTCANADIWSETKGAFGQVAPTPAQSDLDLLTPWRRKCRAIFPFSGACLVRRSLYERLGGFDENLHYSMDMEFYTKLALAGGERLHILPQTLARWRWHEASKTSQVGRHHGFMNDEIIIAERYAHLLAPAERRELEVDIAGQRDWLSVARAEFARPGDNRARKLTRLLNEGIKRPRLLTFRPWLGAVRSALLNA